MERKLLNKLNKIKKLLTFFFPHQISSFPRTLSAVNLGCPGEWMIRSRHPAGVLNYRPKAFFPSASVENVRNRASFTIMLIPAYHSRAARTVGSAPAAPPVEPDLLPFGIGLVANADFNAPIKRLPQRDVFSYFFLRRDTPQEKGK